MGYSISEETHKKIEANRRIGRLCSGGEKYCTARATRLVHMESWTHEIGKGESHKSAMKLCARHAKHLPVGTKGVNFEVTSIEVLPKPAPFEVVGSVNIIVKP